MKLVETEFYTKLIVLSDYLLLGLLWVVISLPVITVVPASVAVLYVLRQWQGGATGHILNYFFTGIRKHFFINVLWSCLTVGIFTITNLLLQENNLFLLISGFVVSIMYLMLLISWTNNCSQMEQASFIRIFEESALDLVVSFLRNLSCSMLILLFTLLVFLFPPFIFLFVGGLWNLMFLILSRKGRLEHE